MWLVGTVYTVYTVRAPHRSLAAHPGAGSGAADHRWAMHASLTFPLPLPTANRRGGLPTWRREGAHAA